ncbi:NADH:flavin oxidoreductase/NADH oxidase [Carbonactinospora thermoautotrophica]|uniref:Oxidoreductase n=1 Tax=Carbonactinospora thermoautotrophica TaxID=1469144 RepID=A0A132MIZ3_9ACTN|nr:NADH:flavin oxidoreductase/NADH oxidase [Carbonactinospora thermoautotrophica]KWW97830.1 oxidoreductase [Carbonactinospora thermoautotrophica]KWW98433.1 NADH:flavin oxidoreductase/NADH oxidase [Carbonactinospora thermoautotrophica]KWX07445.1 oxidoreductase [Carbonactinospora thermoautotrophica]MCX9192060.1 NADH:flavin oxidoreductase/NADH oxidase [Carbonactinospora thermoautotrophica]
MSAIFKPLRLRDLTIPNRVWVSPMCQYSATDGIPNDWHLVHLGQFVLGGAGFIMTEATAVTPEGRISPQDTGIWNDEQAAAWRRIVDFIHSQDRPVGIQLAHAGRKASTAQPWLGNFNVPPEEGGWQPVGPTAEPFGDLAAPRPLSAAELREITRAFAAAAERALDSGFDVVELHFAHGYLAHQLYSPLVNTRTDEYGGDFENRVRWHLETVDAVRAVWPDDKPLFVRISAIDWVDEGGWNIEDSVRLAKLLAEHGVDLIDVSSGGAVPYARIQRRPNYQVPFAQEIRAQTGVPVSAVGMITEPEQAEEIVASGSADAVMLARALMRDPRWPERAAQALGARLDRPVKDRQYHLAYPA